MGTGRHKPMPASIPNKSLKRFMERVVVRSETECWQWIGTFEDKRGYGKITIQWISYRAHRLAYFIATGKDPGHFEVCHTCDNPSCCNPLHLWLGTTADNAADMIGKGRSLKGIKNPAAILTEDEARAIINDPRSGRTLAKEFGVKLSTVKAIKNNLLWRHIERETPHDSAAAYQRNLARGTKSPGAKLTEDQVREIRKDPRIHRLIAKDFGVAIATVQAIKAGRKWKWLK